MTASIRRVWIEEGCISCSLCSDLVPEVFRVEDGMDCVIREGAARFFAPRAEDILEAAEDCPVEVIQVEEEGENDATGHSPAPPLPPGGVHSEEP